MMGSGAAAAAVVEATSSASSPPAAPSVSPSAIPPSPAIGGLFGGRGGDIASTVAAQTIFKREQDATDSMPLTYREYVYVVPPGTSETAAETLLQTQLGLVKTSLERFASGKLVNLAVFDQAFQGKPPGLPLATLAWKDWRDPAVVA